MARLLIFEPTDDKTVVRWALPTFLLIEAICILLPIDRTFQVLLASYRGERYLGEMLCSVLTQVDVDCRVLMSDDFSVEQTREWLDTLAIPLDAIHLIAGPQQGVNANFLHLIHHAGETGLFAYADQDDVWLPQKLQTAQAALNNAATPQIYMGRTTVCDAQLKPLFLSKSKPRAASFKNALLESIAGGNTMAFNPATLSLLQKIQYPVHHDWLSYMVVTACGGEVVFDDTPYVLYRQHDDNLIGANNGISAKLYRLKKLLSREFYDWASDNIQALSAIRNDMTVEHRAIFDGFIRLHEMRGWYLCVARLRLFVRLGLYRQRRLEHIGFMLAAFLGKL